MLQVAGLDLNSSNRRGRDSTSGEYCRTVVTFSHSSSIDYRNYSHWDRNVR